MSVSFYFWKSFLSDRKILSSSWKNAFSSLKRKGNCPIIIIYYRVFIFILGVFHMFHKLCEICLIENKNLIIIWHRRQFGLLKKIIGQSSWDECRNPPSKWGCLYTGVAHACTSNWRPEHAVEGRCAAVHEVTRLIRGICIVSTRARFLPRILQWAPSWSPGSSSPGKPTLLGTSLQRRGLAGSGAQWAKPP